MPYYIYILQCSDEKYYTGLTSDLKRRLREHTSGKDHRAFTYSRRPVKLVWFEELADIETARQREKQVKGMKRNQKDSLVHNGSASLEEAFRSLGKSRQGGEGNPASG